MPLFPNQVSTGADGVEEVTVTSTEPNPFSIDDFIANIGSIGGFAKTNRYKVIVNHPIHDGGGGARQIYMLCEQAEFPGRTFTTSDSRIYGPVYKTPFESQYQEVTMTFINTRKLGVKRYFDAWMEKINPVGPYMAAEADGADVVGRVGSYSTIPTFSGGVRNFAFEYRDNYVRDLEIQQLDEQAKTVYAVKLINAYPLSVAPAQLSFSDDQFHKLSVTFAYDYWEQLPDGRSQPAISATGNSATEYNNGIEVYKDG